jgi:hypothetical protein
MPRRKVVMNINDVKKDISVVIQGPIDDRTYEAIDCYQDFGEVILSTWSSGEDLSLLDSCNPNSNFTVIASDYPSSMEKIRNPGAIFYIATTTYNGSQNSNLPYTLKVRTDELYPNLDAMLENLIRHPKRIHTTDNGFWKQYPYCFSGHIFLAETEVIQNTMRSIISYCSAPIPQNPTINICESILGFFFMLTKEQSLDLSQWKEIFRKHMWITRCVDLPGHLHSGQSSWDRGFKRSSEPYPCGRKEMPNGCHDINNLYQHIEEIV